MVRKRWSAILFLGICLVSSQGFAAIATSGAVYLNAEPGDWVGGGIGADEVLWTHGNQGIFSVTSNFDQGVSVTFDDGGLWNFDFAAPTYDPVTNTNNGNRLEVGYYDNATRWPFNSPTRPGLSFSGNGRGNNTLGGWFDVLDIAYATSGEILRFAVDFRQFGESESMTGPSTYGSLRINSGIPINPVPVPPAIALFLSGLLLFARKLKPAG